MDGWRRLRSATLCRAALSYGGERVSMCGEKEVQRHRQIGWRMALYLRGKISVGTNDLSPKEATEMSRDIKYIGMDVHKEAIVIAVLNGSGKLVMETILETKASSIVQFIHGLRGELHVTWEEGTWAAWLYDLLRPQVQQVVVCNPRRNALLKEGNKSDKVGARKVAELLRTGMLRAVYHGENGLRTLRELGRSYQTINKDLTRVMNRLKALYRGWGIPCAGTQVNAPRCREEWLSKIAEAGVRRRAELLYQLTNEVDPSWLKSATAKEPPRKLKIGCCQPRSILVLMS